MEEIDAFANLVASNPVLTASGAFATLSAWIAASKSGGRRFKWLKVISIAVCTAVAEELRREDARVHAAEDEEDARRQAMSHVPRIHGESPWTDDVPAVSGSEDTTGGQG